MGAADGVPDPDQALRTVARRRFGNGATESVVAAWKQMSAAFEEFPYHIEVVYHSPVHFGPSNLLWETPTGYRATMVGAPYDDLDRWRAIYPPEVFAGQLEKVAAGFEKGCAALRAAASSAPATYRKALTAEANVAEACALHYQSTANQTRFVLARRAALAGSPDVALLERLLDSEMALARRLYELQRRDSRIGFEASNQYYYVPLDLAEKALNVRDLKERWLPTLKREAG